MFLGNFVTFLLDTGGSHNPDAVFCALEISSLANIFLSGLWEHVQVCGTG